MEAYRGLKLLEEAEGIAYEVAEQVYEEGFDVREEDVLLDTDWLGNAIELIDDAIAWCQDAGKDGLFVEVSTRDYNFFCNDGNISLYPDPSHIAEDRSYRFFVMNDVPVGRLHISTIYNDDDFDSYIPMLDIIAELLQEDGYTIITATDHISANNLITRFLSKRIEHKTGYRISSKWGNKADGTWDYVPELRIYWN